MKLPKLHQENSISDRSSLSNRKRNKRKKKKLKKKKMRMLHPKWFQCMNLNFRFQMFLILISTIKDSRNLGIK
jgi:hypothetical protein